VKIELFDEKAANYLYPLETKSVIIKEDDPAKSTTTQPAILTFETKYKKGYSWRD